MLHRDMRICLLALLSAHAAAYQPLAPRLRTRPLLLSAANLGEEKSIADTSAYFPVISTLTLSTAITRLWSLTNPLVAGAAFRLWRDAIPILLLTASVSLSAFVTTFSVLETHYTKLLIGEIYDAPSPEIAQTKTATLDGLQRKFDWLRQYTRNALWASIILMLSALCWRVAFAAPYRGALAVLPATVLALGIGSIVATVRAFRVAYIPSMDRWKTAGRHTDEAI